MDDNKLFFNTFVESSYEALTELDKEVVRLESGDNKRDYIEALRRTLHTIKGSCSMFGFENASRVAHALEDLVVTLNEHGEVSNMVTDLCFEGADLLRRLIEQFVNANGKDTSDAETVNNFIERIHLLENTMMAAPNGGMSTAVAGALEDVFKEISRVREDLEGFHDFSALDEAAERLKKYIVSAPEEDSAPNKSDEIAGYDLRDWQDMPSMQSDRTVRVSEKKVDLFLDCVGELIEVAEVYKYLRRQLEDSGLTEERLNEFGGITQHMEDNVFDLKKALMDIRQVSLKGIFDNLPRLVRNVAHDLGKEVEISISGNDAVVDKSLLDEVEACFVQITRNAVAHGIETPKERRALGKPAKGKVTISAKNDERSLILEISDDGAGLDLDKIRNRAERLELIEPERLAAMTDEEISMLIFSSGITTTDHVDMSSGRGVGLDVVAAGMKKMSGNVSIKSLRGQGTTINIRIPMDVTLSVINGIIAQTGELRFLVPIESVIESVNPTTEMLNTVKGENETLLLRDSILPLYRTAKIFGIDNAKEEISDGVAVVFQCQSNGRNEKAAFFFDKLLDLQQVVVKDISGIPVSEAISGGAILGDGHVGLVLNPEGLFGNEII